jgi:hypothetical protein
LAINGQACFEFNFFVSLVWIPAELMVLAFVVTVTELELCFQLSALRLVRPVFIHTAVHTGITVGVINTVIVFLPADANALLAISGPAAETICTGSSREQILG